VLRDGRNTDLSVTLQAGQQEVSLGASYPKSAWSPSSVSRPRCPGKVN